MRHKRTPVPITALAPITQYGLIEAPSPITALRAVGSIVLIEGSDRVKFAGH
jgi:hypothetical protein